jgi:acetyl esterase
VKNAAGTAHNSRNSEVLKRLDSKTAQFIEKLAAQDGPPIYTLSPSAARDLLNKVQDSYPVNKAPVDIQEITIPAGPKGEISLLIIRSTSEANKNSTGSKNSAKLPVIMYFHGAGWILGDERTFDYLVRQIAHDAQAAVVFVKYTRSPEVQYPVALEEAYAATEYITKHADRFNLDTSRLVVAGDSVGGNMTIGVTMLAKERKGPRIAYQILFYPVTDACMDTESYKQFAEGPWLTKRAMEWFWNAYEPEKEARMKPLLSPLHASVDQLKDLPPAVVITAENDVLRDEGEAYAHKLMEAGVKVRAVRCLGTIHDFVMLNALAATPAAQAALGLVKTTLRELFAR